MTCKNDPADRKRSLVDGERVRDCLQLLGPVRTHYYNRHSMCPQQMPLVPLGLKGEDDRLVSLPIIRCSLTIFFFVFFSSLLKTLRIIRSGQLLHRLRVVPIFPQG